MSRTNEMIALLNSMANRYSHMYELIKDHIKDSDLKDQIKGEVDDTLTDVEEMLALPVVDVVILVQQGEILEVYAIENDVDYVVVDADLLEPDYHDVQTAELVNSYEQAIDAIENIPVSVEAEN